MANLCGKTVNQINDAIWIRKICNSIYYGIILLGYGTQAGYVTSIEGSRVSGYFGYGNF